MNIDINQIETYTPTIYVNNSEPDLDETNLNHTEQALKRVTDAANAAILALKSLDSAKIDAAKIVNNLLATDASTVLSGPMGKALGDRLTAAENLLTQLNGEIGTRKVTGVIKDNTRRGLYCGMDFSDAPADGWLVLIYCFIESNSTGFCIAFGVNGKSEGHIYGFIYSGGWADYVINFC